MIFGHFLMFGIYCGAGINFCTQEGILWISYM